MAVADSSDHEPSLSLLLRALALARTRELAAARAWLERLSTVDGDIERLALAQLWLALGEPLRAMAILQEGGPELELPLASFMRAILASLLGEPERARAERAELRRHAHGGTRKVRELCLLAGHLADEARARSEAWERFAEVAAERGTAADIVRSLRAKLAFEWEAANLGDEPPKPSDGPHAPSFAEEARRLLLADDASGRELFRLGGICEQAGRYALAREAYDRSISRSRDPDDAAKARLALARLAIWSLETAEAREHLAGVAEPGHEKEVIRLRAMIELFEGRPAEALAMLDEAAVRWPESNRDPELWIVRGESLLALGKLAGARDALARSRRIENSVVATVLGRRVELAIEDLPWWHLREKGAVEVLREVARGKWRVLEPWSRRMSLRWWRERAHLRPEILESLASEVSSERLHACNVNRAAATALLDEVKRSLGGNRSSSPTRVIADSNGTKRIEIWRVAPDARQAASSLLHRLWFESPAEVLSRFEVVADRFPESPFPFTYRGELRLWLGDYAEALSDFEEAIRRQPTRWAYIGRAAVYMLLGENRRANSAVSAGVRRFGNLVTATTHVYRGELRRRRGDLKGALEDLEIAVEQRPGRVAARMNLALTYEALGRRDEAGRELRRALNQVPGILWITADALGQRLPACIDMTTAAPLLDHAFRLMRGNRSSWFYSMFDKDGRFRVLPKVDGWQSLALRELSISEASLSKRES